MVVVFGNNFHANAEFSTGESYPDIPAPPLGTREGSTLAIYLAGYRKECSRHSVNDPWPEDVGTLVQNALRWKSRRQYEKAHAPFKNSFNKIKQSYGGNDVCTLNAALEVARNLVRRKKWTKARIWYQEIFRVRRQVMSHKDPVTRQMVGEMANVYESSGLFWKPIAKKWRDEADALRMSS